MIYQNRGRSNQMKAHSSRNVISCNCSSVYIITAGQDEIICHHIPDHAAERSGVLSKCTPAVFLPAFRIDLVYRADDIPQFSALRHCRFHQSGGDLLEAVPLVQPFCWICDLHSSLTFEHLFHLSQTSLAYSLPWWTCKYIILNCNSIIIN